MTSITDLALAAEKEQAQKAKADRTAERAKRLEKLKEQWDERTALDRFNRADPKPQPMPEDDEFTWVPYPGFSYGYPGGRHQSVNGWTWQTDGVRFVHDSDQGCCVILTCPDCGEEHAEHWYGLAELGKLLRTQRAPGHTCREIALRRLAYTIREAAERTKMTPQDVALEAARRQEAWPR